MKPTPRVKLRSVSNKNQSLQDILSTCTIADEVISVEPIINAVLNTKLTLKKATGEKRVHFYNRLDISSILPEDFRPSGNLIADINKLNLMGYDFTEDDLTVSNRRFVAQPYSLGYYGGIIDRLFTDSIAFGVKNLPGLEGQRSYYDPLTHVGISVNGAVEEAMIRYDERDISWDDPSYINPTQALIYTIQGIFADNFPDIEVTVDEANWLTSQNQYMMNEPSGIMTIRNLNPDMAIEVTIQTWRRQDLGSDGIYLQTYHNILPITRLEKRGTNKINEGKPSMVSLYMSDVIDMGGWWPEPNGESNQARNEFGKLLQINGAQGSNVLQDTWVAEEGLPQVSLCVPSSGVSNLMRVITIGSYMWMDEMPVGHFINLLPQEIKLESFLNYEPLVLGPAPMAGMADRVFLLQPNLNWPEVNTWNTEVVLQINDDEYSVSANDTYHYRATDYFLELVRECPELIDKIIFTRLGDRTNQDEFAYFQNLTDEPMHISFFWRGADGITLHYFPKFILEPADTLKGSYSLGPEQNTSQYNPAVAKLVNDGLLETITWRGVKADFEYRLDYSIVDQFRYSLFSSILDFGRTYDDNGDEVIDYFYTASPFLEEFIFNEGMANEVKFQLTPMLLTRGYELY